MTAATTLRSICETRIGKPDDLAFVVDCWTKYELRSDRHVRLRDLTRHVRTLLGVPSNPEAIRELPQLPRLLIAHVPNEPNAILGWAAVEGGRPPCVHYIYVRKDARRQGVASALIGSTDIRLEYSHAAPKGIVVPKGWSLNLERART